LFANAWELARRRLDLLEQYYDPASFRWAPALGVRDGWCCLDAGAGGGSFARWLGERVGATGSVVAADIDVELLKGIAAPNGRGPRDEPACRVAPAELAIPSWSRV
jgi:tRNA A58 N-methylase Trm61